MNGTAWCACSGGALARLVGAQVREEPRAVDDEQADRADDRDRDLMLARLVADLVREPEQDDEEDREQQERRRIVRQPAPESHDAAFAHPAPATMARPSTSSAFAKSEPRIENCATTSSPALSAKRTMNSSGRFPSVDCNAPVTPGPNFAPTDSVAIPIAQATPPSAIPETTKTSTGGASA